MKQQPQDPQIQSPEMPEESAQAGSDIEILETQIGQLTEALQRERADAMNLRRRHDEQIASLKTAVKASVVRDLLPVIDNFERALKQVESFKELHLGDTDSDEYKKLLKSMQDYIKGVEAIVKQFEKTLSNLGVEKIKTVGELFDPQWHEAVSMEDGEGDTEVVSEELQSGYRIGDEAIRHAMVRVTTK